MRRRLLSVLLVSLLLHAALLLLLWRMPITPRAPGRSADQAPVDFEIAYLEPRAPSKPDVEPVAPPVRRSPPKTISQVPPPRPPADPTATPAQPPVPPVDRPVSKPSPPSLDPGDSALGLPVPPGNGGTSGKTLRPEDPSLSESVRRAEEEHRVEQRVQAWAQDAAAESRAQRGLPHPYVRQVGEAMRNALDTAKGGTPAALGAPDALQFLFNRYMSAAPDYGKTGTSSVTVPGPSPHQTEKQKELFGNDALWLQGMTQAAETLQNLTNGEPLLSLTLELRQSANGKLLSHQIVQGSSSPRFDAFVLRVVPEALARLGPVPQEALRGRDELRSVWRVEGWPRLPKKVEKFAHLFGTPAMMGIPADPVLQQLAASQPFAFRPRLLRAY